MPDYILGPIAFLAGAFAFRALRPGRAVETRQAIPDFADSKQASVDSVLDALRGLAEANRTLHGQRIDREFSVVSTTLALYAGTVALIYTSPNLPKGVPFLGLTWAMFLGLAFFVFLYLDGSANANSSNQRVAEWAEDTVAKIVEGRGVRGFPNREGHPNKYRWFWQVVVVAGGAIIAATLITYR